MSVGFFVKPTAARSGQKPDIAGSIVAVELEVRRLRSGYIHGGRRGAEFEQNLWPANDNNAALTETRDIGARFGFIFGRRKTTLVSGPIYGCSASAMKSDIFCLQDF